MSGPSPEPATPAAPSPRPSLRERLLRSPRAHGWAAALVGALCVILAMPNVDLGLPMVFAFVPVLVVARDRPWRQRFRIGWLMGFAYHVALFRWIPFTLTEMTPIPLPVTWIMWMLYAAWHGMQVGVFLALAEPVRRAATARTPALSAVAVALTGVVVEWLWPVIFPWSVGHALWQVGPVAAIQAFFGVPGIAFFVLLLNAALADAWLRVRGVRAAGLTLAGLLALGTTWFIVASNATPTRTLRVAILQPNYSIDEKKHATFEVRKQLVTRFEGQLRGIERGRFDLVVASEGAFPMSWRLDATTALDDPNTAPTRHVGQVLADGPHAEAIIGGLRAGELAPIDPDNAKSKLRRKTYNAAVHLSADGAIVDHYDKRVLVPFSEHMPLSDVFPSLKNAVSGIGDFEHGEARCHFTVSGVPVGCGICYETLFADESRNSAGDDARLFVNLTIDTWFGKNVAPEMHLMAHASRAVELGIPLVRAALTGISALILPTGEVAASLPIDVAGVLAVDVPITDLSTPYRAVGPIFAWVAWGAVLLGLVEAFRRRRELFPRPAVQPSQDP